MIDQRRMESGQPFRRENEYRDHDAAERRRESKIFDAEIHDDGEGLREQHDRNQREQKQRHMKGERATSTPAMQRIGFVAMTVRRFREEGSMPRRWIMTNTM